MGQGRVVSPVFVGRGAELAVLEGVLRAAAAGEPAVVIVGGEAGVGKSRLVTELMATRAPPDARVVVGNCSGFAPGSLPYAPIVSGLRNLVRSVAGMLTCPRARTRRCACCFLSWYRWARSATGGRGPPEQAQLFSQLEAVFDAVAAAAPLILVIEDLHWADRSSLEFLAYLCHGLHRQRTAIVCTHRDDEVPAAPASGRVAGRPAPRPAADRGVPGPVHGDRAEQPGRRHLGGGRRPGAGGSVARPLAGQRLLHRDAAGRR